MKHTLNTVLSNLRRNQNVKVGTSTVSVDKPVGIGTWGKLDYLRKVHNYRIVNNRRGFSLLELIVVLAIILIVIAIALPSFIGIRDNAQQSAHQANVKILEDAATIFVIENPQVETIWCPHEGTESDPQIEITDTNIHDSWQKYVKVWPVCPIGGSYTVEIKSTGEVIVSPGVE